MKQPLPHPPAWLDRILEWFVAEDLLEEIQGDLHEAYQDRAQTNGKQKAALLYAKDVLKFFRPYAFEKYSAARQFLPMAGNYVKVGLRNILHRKGFTTINLVGLTLGMSAVMLIGTYLHHELSYDQQADHHEQVYRLMNHYRDQVYACMPFPDYYQTSEEDQFRLINQISGYEEVQNACHFVPSQSAIGGGDQFFVEIGTRKIIAENLLFTNTAEAFFSLFPMTFLQGSSYQIDGDQRIILTESSARRCWGDSWQEQNLIGSTLLVQGEEFEVMGVIEDVPGNVHYDFDWMIIQRQIPSWGAYTYLQIKEGSELESVMDRLNAEIDLVYPGYKEDILSKGVIPIQLQDIHFTDGNLYELKPVMKPAYLTTIGLIGAVLLLIILINYTNLSIAMYADRQAELGIRKALGAMRRDITSQLVAEAVILALLCFPACWLILAMAISPFEELMNIQLFGISQALPWTHLIVLFGLLFMTGLISGLYPGLVYGRKTLLTLISPNKSRQPLKRFFSLRRVLLTSQMGMVIILISVTWFIRQQIQFIETMDLGFEQDGVVYFDIPGVEKYDLLKAELEQMPEVAAIGANGVPGSEMFNQLTFKLKGTDDIFSDGTEEYIDAGTFRALKIDCPVCEELEQGKSQVFLINRTAAERLAGVKGVEPEALIGETIITEPEWENEEFGFGIPHQIDGIIDDYKYFSIRHPYQPMLISVFSDIDWVYTMVLNLQTDNWAESMKSIQKAYEGIEPERPFRATLLSDRVSQLYESEQRSGTLIIFLSIVALMLSLMGVSGMVSYVTFSRQKEIGIRRIIGASDTAILRLFGSEYAILIGVALILAIPIVLTLTDWWLEGFAYHIEPQIWAVIAVAVLITIPVQAIVSYWIRRVGKAHPVTALTQQS